MTKSKDKRRENTSVAGEIDRLEERRARCQDNRERAELRSGKEKLDKELQVLRGENRRNMLLSVALLAVSALSYYAFFSNED